jgi:pyruvate dehydrogenase E1 component beta subunit
MNTPNVENTQVGVGFGLMLNGVSSIFYMKQQDFLLLGIDQLVNTYNFVRQGKPQASFTIVTIVVDKGYEGIQSSLNNLGDFCSIARIPGYTISNRHDADRIIADHLVTPGFRIVAVSQRLFNTEIIECPAAAPADINDEILGYYKGGDATIVCFNFSFPQGLKLWNELRAQGRQASLFTVNTALPADWTGIIRDAARTRRLVVLDDSKCVHRSCYQLSHAVRDKVHLKTLIMLVKDVSDEHLCPHSEEFVVNYERVIKLLKSE